MSSCNSWKAVVVVASRYICLNRALISRISHDFRQLIYRFATWLGIDWTFDSHCCGDTLRSDLALALSDDFIWGVLGQVAIVRRLLVSVDAAMFSPRLDRIWFHLDLDPSLLLLMTTRSGMMLMDMLLPRYSSSLSNDTGPAIYRMVVYLMMVEVFVERWSWIAVNIVWRKTTVHLMIRVRYL